MVNLEKYIGRTVEIIYLDRTGALTQRRIRVRSVAGGIVRAQCLATGAPRTFRVDSILALQPVMGRAV